MKRRKQSDVPFGYFALELGTRARVDHLSNVYSLPAGLQPGDEVVVLKFECAYIVQKDERKFTIGSGNIREHFDETANAWVESSCRKNPGDRLAQLRAFTAETKMNFN